MGKNHIVEIGMPWGFNEWTEINTGSGAGYFTKKIYSNINVVDFIPIIPRLNTEQAKETTSSVEKLTSMLKNLYVPDPEKGIKYYNSLLMRFGLAKTCNDVHILRLYMTDDTQLAETITNEYSNNIASDITSSIAEKSEVVRTVKSNLYLTPNEFIDEVSRIDKSGAFSGVKKLGKLAEAVASGMRIDFPVKWDKTSYTRRTSLNVVLSSPYGHPESVYEWIIKPLLYIILLGTPVNIYGAVGWPLYCRIKSHGLFDITMGAIESITIDRGGQNTLYNIYKQPLKVVLSISIRDLYSSLSVDYTKDGFQVKSEAELRRMLTSSKSIDSDYSAEMKKLNTPMPTVDKLLSSFAPVEPKYGKYDSRTKYIKNPNVKPRTESITYSKSVPNRKTNDSQAKVNNALNSMKV